MSKKCRVAIVGVGNCASSLIQGLEFYKNVSDGDTIPGLMHVNLGGYHIRDIEIVAAFDVDSAKVGFDIASAIFAPVNNTPKFCNVPLKRVYVKKGRLLDGLGKYQSEVVTVSGVDDVDVVKELDDAKADIVVNYLPVGSQLATEYYVNAALAAGCGFVNCIPVFVASNPMWANSFKRLNLPIIGDDVKSQVGATIVHRVLTNLFRDRGVKLDRTYQINFGGNSVTGDQKIQLLKNGKSLYGQIGEITDKLVEKYGMIRLDGKDIVLAKDIEDKYECLTTNNDFKTVKAPITAFIRHKLRGAIYEIETALGRTIKITPDHNVFILSKKGRLRPIPVKNLKAGTSYIAVPAELPLDLPEKPYLNLSGFEEVMKTPIIEGQFQVHHKSTTIIKTKFALTDEFLLTVGMWLGDGSYSSKVDGDLDIACAEDKECLEIFHSLSNQLNINIGERKWVSYRFGSVLLGRLCRAMGLVGSSYTKKIPHWVFDLSNRQIGLVIKGYLSADGTISGKQVRWGSVSKELAEDIQTLLFRLGIESQLHSYSTQMTKKGKLITKGKGYISAAEYIWGGAIGGKTPLERFTKMVGFLQNYKNNNLSLARIRTKRDRRKSIACTRELVTNWGFGPPLWNWPKTAVTNDRMLENLHRITDKGVRKRIRNACQNDTLFLKIRSIRKIEDNNPTYVYDLSVEKYERFICSNILVHNTDFLNMLERSRLESKKKSKTDAVQSQLDVKLEDKNIHVGPSDYIPWLEDRKICNIRMEGTTFGDMPLRVDVHMEVVDSPNSAGVVIDAIRFCKLAMDNKVSGPIIPSSYLMKSPPIQMTDAEARTQAEHFIKCYI